MEDGTSFINSDGRIGNLQKSAQIAGGLMLGVGLAAGGVQLFTKLAGAVGAFFRSRAANRVEASIEILPHGPMVKTPGAGQSHHLNQDAVFKSVTKTNDGLAIKLEGNAIRDVGSPH